MNVPLSIIKELSIIVLCVASILFFTLLTGVRLGYVPPQVVAPLLHVEPAYATTWSARVGRLHWNGNASSDMNNWRCDDGYWPRWNHFDPTNRWDSLWLTCQAGDW